MKTPPILQQILNFNLDTHLNPYIPPSPLSHLPTPLSHFLGHRAPGKPDTDPPALLTHLHTFIATLAGLSVASAAVTHTSLDLASTIPSLGAGAILDFNTVRSPLAQPRNAICGNTLSAVLGVAFAKAFHLTTSNIPESSDLTWASGILACACASVVMSLTGTVHPPGGATAIIACTVPSVQAVGWRYVPAVLVASTLMCAVACLLNNVGRRFPMYWWSGAETGAKWRRGSKKADGADRGKEGMVEEKVIGGVAGGGGEAGSGASVASSLEEGKAKVERVEGATGVSVSADGIRVAPGVVLEDGDLVFLRVLQEKLRSAAAA